MQEVDKEKSAAQNLIGEDEDDADEIKEKKEELKTLVDEVGNLQEQLEALTGGDEVTDGVKQPIMLLTSFMPLAEGAEEQGILEQLTEMIVSLTEVKAELEAKIRRIEQLKLEVANLESEIENKESQLEDLENRLEELRGELEEQEQINQNKAQYVIGLIEALPKDITYEAKEAVEEARKEYNGLTRTQKSLVTNYNTLLSAEEALKEIPEPEVDKSQLQAKLTEALRLKKEDYTAETWTALQSAIAVAEFTILDDDATETLVANALRNLTDALKGLEIKEDPGLVEANNFRTTHSEALALTVDGVDLSNEDSISLALNAYNELTDPAQTILSNEKSLLDNLQARINELKQEDLDQVAIEAVIAQINRLPSVEDLALTDKEAVEAARIFYDALTTGQKECVKNIDKLIAAEVKITELEENAAYESLKSLVEAKVAAYELLAQADLTTQELITAANDAKAAIVLDGLTEADKETFQTRITAADELVSIAQTILDEQVAVNEAVENFRNLVSEALSLKVETVEIGDKDTVVGALDLYNKLSEPIQAKLQNEKTLIDDLLTEIEKQETKNTDAADTVTALINTLPEIEALTLDYKEAVETARAAYNNLTDTQKGLISSADLAKLVAAEGQILVLLADKEASDKASDFKENHKDALALTLDTVTIDNKIIVEAALAAYADLAPEVQARLGEGEKDLLDNLKQKILELEQQAAEDQAAAEKVDGLISALPSVDDLVLSDKKDVLAVRTAYDALTETQQKFVTKLELLITIEAKMTELEKTVDLVGDEVIDGYYVVNRAYTDNSVKNEEIGSIPLWIGDKEVTDSFDIIFYDAEGGSQVTSFDLSNGGTTFKAYMVAEPKEDKDYYKVETDVFFKYGSVTIGNNDNYYTIEDALDQANSGTIFVKHNTSFADKEVAKLIYGGTDFTIKKGATVLLPYSEALSEKIEDTPSGTAGAISRNKAYVELLVPENIKLNVNGTLTVNAMRANIGTKYSGHVTGANYSQLHLKQDSKINVNGGGTLSSMGFIYGQGKVEALSGSTVNDNLFNQSFRGGTATLGVQGEVFPFDQFTINNIETDLIINTGANYITKNLIYMSSSYYKADLKLAGSDKNSLIQLTRGKLIKTYDTASGLLTMNFHGDAQINVSSLKLGNISANSKGKDMPFDGTWKFNFAAGSNIVIDSWMVLLPGAQMDIAEGANVTITENGRLGVFNPYEHLDDYNTYPVTTKSNKNVEDYYRVAPVFNYDANTPAILTINGALNVEGGLAGRVHKTNTGTLTWGDTIYKTYDYKYVIGSAGDAKSNSRELTFWEEGESTLAVVATPSTVVTKDKTVSTIVATVKDGSNNPIQKINLTFSGGKGTWSATSGTSDNDGKVTVTYTTSEDEDEGTSLTVTEASGNKTAKVNLNVKKSSGGGSCPFVYSHDGEEYHFEHESFPFAVNSALETASYGTLRKLQKVNGKYQVKVAERLDEKSYLNGFKLLAVDYPAGEGIGEVFADIFGRPHTIIERILPIEFVDSDGNSWLSEIKTKDQLIGSRQEGLNEGRYITSYIASYDKPQDAGNMAKLMVRTQKSPLITQSWAWFLDKLDSVNNMWWMEKVMELPENYDKFIDFIDMVNLRVELWDGEEWVEQGQIKAGRHLLEEFLIPLDISGISSKAGEIKVRLTFGTGLYEIDQISIDFSEDQIANIVELEPDKALFNGERDIKDVISNFDDCDRIKMLTGDEIDLFYDVPELNDGHERGFTVAIKGYYHMDADGKEKPIPSEWSDIGTDGIIEALYKIGDEDAIKAMPAFEWMTGLIESLYGAPMEEKIEKTIVDNVLPWLNEKK